MLLNILACYSKTQHKTVQVNGQVGGVVGRVDSAFDSCLKDMGSNPAEATHCVTTVGRLFTPIVHCGAESRLQQLSPGIAGTSVVTLGKSFTYVGSGLLSLSSLIGG